MDLDEVWLATDAERLRLADLLDGLGPEEWSAPSLCAGWRVRDVAAHLTLAHTGPLAAAWGMVRARGSFDRMVHDGAVRQAALPVPELAARLRAMAGSRRRAPGVTPMEPLLDALVHGLDITVPLARPWPVPPVPAAAAATRVWTMGWPFSARRRLQGLHLSATDASWSAGEGADVHGPIAALLLLLTGRTASLDALSGPGAAQLPARLGLPSAAGGPSGPVMRRTA
jgi:uncharacterized protein (TIGR03083 family)